jgi:predicted dehydrogenase
MLTRRTFFTLAAGSAAAVWTPSCAKPGSASNAVRVGVIGLKGRGKDHLASFGKMAGARIVALCDVDQKVLDEHQAALAKNEVTVATDTDYRRFLERKDIDAVVIATPNHTHTLIAMTALAAGKHVYVEKPVSHNLDEGRRLVQAAAATPKLVVQHGMQRRSCEGWHEAIAWLNTGALGKMHTVRCINYKARKTILKTNGVSKPPKTVDYNLWCGPRAITPPQREKFHYDWHWFWDFGNGDIGNQGPHQWDVARWAMGEATHPSRIVSLGGRWGYEDDGQTPNTQLAIMEWPDGRRMVFDNRGLPGKGMDWENKPMYRGIDIGNVIECEGGYLNDKGAWDKEGGSLKSWSMSLKDEHYEAFVTAVQNGKLTDARNSAETGHYGAALAHLSNISYRLGAALGADAIRERLGDAAHAAAYGDVLASLQADGIDLAAIPPVLGAALEFDDNAEKFSGPLADEANKLLTGFYRPEFSLPKIA